MADIEAIAASMAAAMGGENGRRLAASHRPGHGALLGLPQPPSGPSTAKPDVAGPVVGLGYSNTPGAPESQVASYVVPSYADPSVGGVGYAGGRQEPPIRVFTVRRSAPAGDPIVVASVPSRPRRLRRLAARFRK